MFDKICVVCVNAVSVTTTIYLLINCWHLHLHRGIISTFVICMILWAGIDLVLGGVVFYLNDRFKLFHSEFFEREERNQRSRQIEEALAREFGVPHTGPRVSEKGYWRNPR